VDLSHDTAYIQYIDGYMLIEYLYWYLERLINISRCSGRKIMIKYEIIV
jgi:hypothetical protein